MKLNVLKSFLKVLPILVFSLMVAHFTVAQTYPYQVDFESSSKNSYADTNSLVIGGVTWKMPGAVIGTSASDKKNGLKSARIRLTDNDTGSIGSIYMVSNLSNGAGVLSFNAAMYGTQTDDSVAVYYSTNGGSTWVLAGHTTSLTSSLVNFSFNLNISGNVRIKLSKINTTNVRVNIDDISISSYGSVNALNILSKSPTGSGVPLNNDSLVITYDSALASGVTNAHVFLHKVGAAAPIDSFLFSDATIDSNIAVFHNIILENNTQYYVTIDSGLFKSLGNAVSSMGISDSTSWMFSTVDSTPLPPVTAVTFLHDTSFTCNGSDTIGSFHRYNELGTKQWYCSYYGNGDSSAVYVNGGYTGGSDSNIDWLITNAPLNFSSFTTINLGFAEKRRFIGTVTRQLLISTDYTGGNPNNANWTEISVPDFANLPDSNSFSLVNNISLTAYKNAPFYLAFKYTCGNTGAYEWTIDDIIANTSNGTSVNNINKGNIGLSVLGVASSNNINLAIRFTKDANAVLSLYDLSGRIIFKQSVQLINGSKNYSISNLSLPSGMYIIRLNTGADFGVTKAIVN